MYEKISSTDDESGQWENQREHIIGIQIDGEHLDREVPDLTVQGNMIKKMDDSIASRPRLMVLLQLCSLVCIVWLLRSRSCPDQLPNSATGLAKRPQMERREGFWSPEYEIELNEEAEIASRWRDAVPGFGIVAVDTDWALSQGLKPSRPWPIETSKSVYVLQVYHALHCTRRLRKQFMAMVRGEPVLDYYGSHGAHCFEIIRNELMCTATDTLFASRLNETNGDALRVGQDELRQCNDWEYLRDWAGERSAGYIVDEDRNLEFTFLRDSPTRDGWYISSSEEAQALQ